MKGKSQPLGAKISAMVSWVPPSGGMLTTAWASLWEGLLIAQPGRSPGLVTVRHESERLQKPRWSRGDERRGQKDREILGDRKEGEGKEEGKREVGTGERGKGRVAQHS